MTPRRIKIFDTSLRDGEQAPGYSMTPEGKMKMAHALAALNVDIIEAGFAAASPGDAAAIHQIAGEIQGPTICSLSRASRNDIDKAAQALAPAGHRRLHIFLGTSPSHREAKLQMSQEQVLAAIAESVAYAKDKFDEVEFSAEDAIRTERPFLVTALQEAANAGADVLNVPDTVGYSTPDEIYDLFSHLMERVERADHVIFSAHCHDDLGMAVANSLAAAQAGASQIECTVNGIGERAGNAALEEVAMALRTRADHFAMDTGINTHNIMTASKVLSKLTNTAVPRNKAIVGSNAFAHEAGIHQHGVLANPETYEIMRPADIGLPSNALILGKHSGKHALAARAADLGFTLSDQELGEAFLRFKDAADMCGIISDAHLEAIITGVASGEPSRLWQLSRLEIRAPVSDKADPIARVELEHNVRGRICDLASAPGALDASFKAVSHIMGQPAEVLALEMHYMAADPDEPREDGQGADVRIQIELEVQGETFGGLGRGRDVVPACVAAYIDALNNARTVQRRRSIAQKDTDQSPKQPAAAA